MSADQNQPHSPLRWAIVGTGHIARKFADNLKAVGGARLEAVVSRHPARAGSFAAEFGARRTLDSEEALAADPDVDLIYIATPHPAHFPTARRMLLAGKAVLCEKPLCLNAGQTRELIALSRERRVFLMEAMWTRFLPVYGQIGRWLAEGRIGEPHLLTSTFCAELPSDPEARWLNPELAGGSLLDLGVYNLAVSQFVMKEAPEEIYAFAKFSSTGVDEMLSVSMRYRGGAISQFTCGMSGSHDNTLAISGEKGFIHVPSRFIHAGEATLTSGAESLTIRAPLRAQGFEYEIEEAMRCFRAGLIESPLMPHADTLQTMEIMDQIRRRIDLRYPMEEDIG